MTTGIPQENKISDLMRCIAQLEALASDRSRLADLDEADRTRLMKAAGMIARPDRIAMKQMTREFRRRHREQAKVRNAALRAANVSAKSATGLRQTRIATVYSAPEKCVVLPGPEKSNATPRLKLETPQACYVCKASYTELHFFYDSMCKSCGDYNYQKRFQTADCQGRIALVTGARVKIGFQAALMLLRAGATVIVTTRFPNDAALRYRGEHDFDGWKNRLHIYGLDLRHSPSVELFAQHLSETLPTLDFLLNNAAQTVRKPRGFYDHMMEGELNLPDDPDARELLSRFYELRVRLEGNASIAALTPKGHHTAGQHGLLAYTPGLGHAVAPGLLASAQMSQIPLLPEDLRCGSDVFPSGQLDADMQQVDLRTNNSWRMRLADVSTAEMLEIQLINAVAPFILNSRLKSLMLRPDASGNIRRDKHIVNVSAMEGKFTRYTKTDKHPHTNMAKAALNMMTQTSAADYVRDGIHMNAVDTGWVTDEDPAQHAHRKRTELGFEPPLDIVDGAARIVDPVFTGITKGEHIWGKFLKDYQPTTW